ncbi:hypothetical protein ACK3Y1_09940 [Aeromonas caviae]
MKTLNIEIHYFSNFTPSITTTHAFKIMDELKDLELFPQIYQEALPGGNPEQRFMFSNGVTGLTIRCQRDRVMLIQGLNPNLEKSELSNFNETLNHLCSIMKRFASTLDKVFNREHTFNRLAIVSRHIEQEKFKEFLSNLNEIARSNLPWVEQQSKEITFRTGHRFDVDGEIYNEIVMINDGLMDMSSNGVSLTVSPCILVEIDVNSIPENIDERFKANTAESSINIICEKQMTTLSKVHGFVERA